MDRESFALQSQIDELQRRMPIVDNRQAYIAAQSRCDSITRALVDPSGAPGAVNTEGLLEYRCRLLRQIQKYSPKYKDSDLSKVTDAAVFDSVEAEIVGAAEREMRRPTQLGPGELREVREHDRSGRVVSSFYGDSIAAWRAFTPPPRFARFLTPGARR